MNSYSILTNPRFKIVSLTPYIFLSFIFLINLFIFWPGQMEPDSICQYNAAISGIFSDHHPPVMSLLWKFLNIIHTGSGLMFLFHLILLYSSTLIFMIIFNSSQLIWLYACLPLFPQIFIYSSLILKDVGFAFSYLFIIAILSYSTMKTKSLNLYQIIIILFLLSYGTSVKFQAIYICPIITLIFSYCLNNLKFNLKTFILSFFIYTLIFFSIKCLHDSLIPPEKRSHSWQFVKLYDLAAISIKLDDPIFPDFVKNNPNFSFENIKKNFTHEKVDALIFPDHAPLIKGTNESERKQLLYCWYKNILKHPYIYLSHRFKNLFYILNAGPLQKLKLNDLEKYKGLEWLKNYKNLSKIVFKISSLAKFLKFGFLLPFIIFYFILGLININKNPAALPLIFMNSISLALVFILLFFSMAGMLRYVYIAMCMFHSSHGFAYLCWKNRLKNPF